MAWVYNTTDGTPTNGHAIAAIAISLTATSLSALILRFYVRGWLVKSVGADDWIVLSAWVMSCGYTVVTTLQTKWGLGLESIDDLPDSNRYMFGVLQYAGWPLYILSIFGFKLSLLISYFRFIPQGMCKYGVSIVTLTCILFHIAYFIAQINLCRPISRQWDPSITNGQCLNTFAFYISMSSLTIVFDFNVYVNYHLQKAICGTGLTRRFSMFLPFPVLLNSKLQTRKKIILLGLFALGFFVTVIQIIRIQYFRSYTSYLYSAPIIMWGTVEANLGIICACIPTMSPLIRTAAERTRRGTIYFKASWGSSGPGSAARWSFNIKNRRQSHKLPPPAPAMEKDPKAITKTDSRDPILSSADIVKQTDITITHDPRPLPTAHSGDFGAPVVLVDHGGN
ncbi:hypothetical protein F4779DRAFT_617732 [Xylariaceae sp. FL0662B]|nr:hypothetical protein F4779DRAFT_617732 [Xylariaceae sp. FL0662B]